MVYHRNSLVNNRNKHDSKNNKCRIKQNFINPNLKQREVEMEKYLL
jgi:hypothetical protein